jgi:putative transcriptional regulator
MKKNKNLGQELVEALKEANSYHDGQITLRTQTIELPDEPKEFDNKQIKKIRENLNLSQPVFARFLGVTDKAVKAWEQGGSHPNGCALRLLEIAKNHPKDFFKLIG